MLNFKTIKMKNSKSNFKALVAKMDALKETEQGKLKGGYSVLPVVNVEKESESNYVLCGGNGYCPQK